MGHEFENRNSLSWTWVEVTLGDDIRQVEIKSYGYEYMADLCKGEPPSVLHDPDMHLGVSYSPNHPTSRQSYEDVLYSDVDLQDVQTISHVHGRQEGKPEGLWQNLLCYLKDGIIPDFKSQMECWSFWKHSQNFILHDNCLWKTEKKGKSPRLVITDLDHQKLLISQVHNEVGHRGHDSTYRLLSECYYWPDLYDSIAYFVCSCYACQLHSKSCPQMPFSATWDTAILQRFDLDTVHIEDGYGSKHFLGKCETGSIYWSVMFNVCGQEVCSGMVYTSSPLNRVPATLCREVWQARVFS